MQRTQASRSNVSEPVQLKLLLNPVNSLFPQGARQAGWVVKKPGAERGDTFSIFCGYQRILPGGSKRNDFAARSCGKRISLALNSRSDYINSCLQYFGRFVGKELPVLLVGAELNHFDCYPACAFCSI
jgi:hypothetical protein